MSDYLEILRQGGWVTISITVLVVIVFASVAVLKLAVRSRSKSGREDKQSVPVTTRQEERKEAKTSILGTGLYKCMAVRRGNIIDFTTMPEPIGELYQADPSCPQSGGTYIVRELEDGKLVDYDPREVPVKIELSPEYAWFATHWDIVSVVFSVPSHWWQSTSTWFAAGMMVLVFITALVTLGG